ncbi:MAG TPA: response regulator [Pirellulales bacterium]|nr:response regulator [Pirellulales bacterium]
MDALRRAEANYRSIFENAVEGIFQTTLEGRYLSVNPALARIYGYDSPKHLADSIGDIERQLYVDPNRRDEFARVIARDGVVSNFESEVYRADGGIIWISENARAVRDRRGEIEYYEGTVEDITERKQSESLFREKEAAEAANRAKSQFLAHMSHELRTPLNGVIGMLDLLLAASSSPQQQRYTSIARSSADLLLSVINQILDFSKIEAGKLELERIDFQFRLILEETLEMVAPKATQKGLELVLDMPPGLSATVRGDPNRLRQVIVNMLGNAIKFTERGQVRVRVRLLSETAERLNVHVAVEDTGVGIPADRLNRLFRSFSQVDASTTRQFGGTGLGLAISKQLVELMGGEIGVESTLGRGSSFWFRLPLAKADDATLTRPIVPPELRSMRVLVVDDNPTNREILFRQLSAWQVRVETACDGVAALKTLERTAATGQMVHLAIIDCHMPGMDGYELARRLAAHEDFRSIPLVMLTSLTAPQADANDPPVALAGSLTKPVRQSQLLDAVLSATARQRSAYLDSSSCGLAELPASPSSSAAASTEVRSGPSRARLLLAEDNEVNRVVALEILTMAGFECDMAGTGREAIERIVVWPYDVVLMDCHMPEMDGLEATREIRRLESEGLLAQRGYRLPIVAVTANATEGDRQMCERAGMDDYLTKPLDSAKLISILNAIVGPLVSRRVDASSTLTAPIASPTAAVPTTSEAPATKRPTTEQTQPAQVFDFEALTRRCLGNQGLMQRILAKFVDRLPVLAGRLDETVRQGRLADAAAEAHSLKGSAANLSAERLQQAVGALEAACHDNDRAAAIATTARVCREVEACVEFIARRPATCNQIRE